MIVYREVDRWIDAAAVLRRSCDAMEQALAAAGPPSHAAAVRLLVEFGELESAWCDHLLPEADDAPPTAVALRRAAVGAGHLLRCAWTGAALPSSERRALAAALAALRQEAPPARLRAKAPEGFAFYGLYPETYLEAADQFAGAKPPGKALCLGLRSIGAPLSAVVAAALEARGWQVRAETVRPRGSPFARRLVVADPFVRSLERGADGEALIVDEGPGLSGSSLAGAAALLSALGYPDHRISLFPSWNPGPRALRSPEARERWPRHAAYLGSFESAWVRSGRLSAAPLRPMDEGRWRELFFRRDGFPAVQPQHERRKYLVAGDPPLLLKFAGLGPYGDAAAARASALSRAGFTPRVEGVRHGFLRQHFAAGRPLREGECTPHLLEHAARYLAFLRREFPAEHRTSGEALRAMALHNSRELLRGEAGDAASLTPAGAFEDAPAVEVDGRLQPWEWLATERGYLKVDAVDHHADHFFPGCADAAWDLAGFAIEFDLDAGAEELLLRRFARLSGDGRVGARMPAFRLAYAAFRAGYAQLAAQSTEGSPESARFRALESRYTRQLRRQLTRLRNPALG